MHYTYVLISHKDGKLYIGSTSDLKARVQKHLSGFVAATKHRQPLELIHYEAFLRLSDAKRRELYLKGGKGHGELKILLQDSFRKIKYKFS